MTNFKMGSYTIMIDGHKFKLSNFKNNKYQNDDELKTMNIFKAWFFRDDNTLSEGKEWKKKHETKLLRWIIYQISTKVNYYYYYQSNNK